MTLTERLEKFAFAATLAGVLTFEGGIGYVLYRNINAPLLDCKEALANPLRCANYENDAQRSLAYTRNREETYKAEKAMGKWTLFTSVPPMLLGVSALSIGEYLRKRKK